MKKSHLLLPLALSTLLANCQNGTGPEPCTLQHYHDETCPICGGVAPESKRCNNPAMCSITTHNSIAGIIQNSDDRCATKGCGGNTSTHRTSVRQEYNNAAMDSWYTRKGGEHMFLGAGVTNFIQMVESGTSTVYYPCLNNNDRANAEAAANNKIDELHM